MDIFTILLIGLGLSMDAFSVSVTDGIVLKKPKPLESAKIALFFGGFQFMMPCIGYILASSFSKYITAFDHWIAFFFLFFIGGKMIFDTIRDDDDACGGSCDLNDKLNYKELVVMAIATSIDALAVGIAMACLSGGMNVGAAIAIIGVITLFICFAGVIIGNKFGAKFEKNASYAGGVILILIGLKILLEHLGLLDKFFTWINGIF